MLYEYLNFHFNVIGRRLWKLPSLLDVISLSLRRSMKVETILVANYVHNNLLQGKISKVLIFYFHKNSVPQLLDANLKSGGLLFMY